MNLKHGCYSDKAKIPLSVKKYASHIREGLIKDYANGDESSMSFMVKLFIDEIVALTIKSQMIWAWVMKHGVVLEDGNVQPILGRWTRYANRINRALRQLEKVKEDFKYDPVDCLSKLRNDTK